MAHEECQVRFDEDSAGCCQHLFCNLRKRLDFIVVCFILLIVLLSVILALYHGIRLKEFSSVAIGFGIWLPSIVLGMVCVYTAFTCSQKSTITTSHLTSVGNSILNSQSETRLNVFRYQPEISQESSEIPLQVIQESKKHPRFGNYEDLPGEQSCKLARKKHFRSLSSSNLHRYNNKHNLRVKSHEECGYSRDRVDHGEYTSRNKSQQEEPNPRRRNFRRSLSETRAVKNEDLEFARSASHDNALLHSPEMYTERNCLSQMKEYDNSNFYPAVAGESWRENFKNHSIRKNGDFLKYKYGTDNLSAGEYIEGNEHPLQFLTYYPQGIAAFQNYSSKTPCREENRNLQRFQTEFSENLGGIKKYPSNKLCSEKSGHLHQFQANSQGSIGEILEYSSKKPSTQENRHLQQFPSTGFPKNRLQNYSSKVPTVERSEHLMRFQRDSSKNIDGVKRYSLKKLSLTIEGNGHGHEQHFQTDSPESTDELKKYPTKMFSKPIFKPSRVIYHPQGNHPLMSHAVPSNINHLQNNNYETDYPSRNGYEKSFQYESNEMPSGLLGETRTHHNPMDRTFRGDVQFSRAGIKGFQSLQDFADIGYLSNVNKNTRNILPVNRSNVEINSSDHMQTRGMLPFSYLQPTPQVNCYPQTGNNSHALGHSMLKRRSPREKSKISEHCQNNTGLNHIPDWDSPDNSDHIV